MRRKLALALAVTFLLQPLWPVLALAQAPAGVVTTIAGSATVLRVGLPAPRELKFRDDVFVQDKIATREKSVVRVLMGGKAVVTVRELSVLTITEEAGRSRVDLESGKIALAVARQRMRLGEAIELRTPNAIAGVRGTVVIVEVIEEPTAQLVPGIARATRDVFSVLKGSIDLLRRGAPPTEPPRVVGVLQQVNVTRATTSPPVAIPPAQVAQLVQNLKSEPQHKDTPENQKKEVSNKEQAKGAALASLVAPEQPAKGAPAKKEEPQKEEKKEEPPATTEAPPTAPPPAEAPPTAPPPAALPPPPTLDTTLLAATGVTETGTITGALTTFLTGGTTDVFLGGGITTTGGGGTTDVTGVADILPDFTVTTDTTPKPLVSLPSMNIALGTGGQLATVTGIGAVNQVTIANPLAAPFVTADGPSPNIGGLNSGPTFQLTNTSVTATGASPALVTVTGTSATAGGALVSATGTFDVELPTISSTRPLLGLASSVTIGGALALGADALAIFGSDVISLTGGTLTSTGNLFSVGTGAALITTSGSLLSLPSGTPTVFIAGDVLANAGAVTGAAGGVPLIKVAAGSLSVIGDLVQMGSTLSLTGPIVHVSGGTASAGRGLYATGGTLTTTGSELIKVSGGALTVAGPLADLTGMSVSLGAGVVAAISAGTLSHTTGPPIRITGGSLTAAAIFNSVGGTATLTDSLEFTNTAVSLNFLISTGGVTHSFTQSPASIIRMTNSTLALGGGAGFVNLSTSLAEIEGTNAVLASPNYVTLTGLISVLDPAGDLIRIADPGVTLAQPVLKSTSNSIVLSGGGLFTVSGSATSSTTSALINLDPVTVTGAGDVIRVTDTGSLSVSGTLLADVSGSIGTLAAPVRSLVSVEGTLTAGSASLITLNATTLAAKSIARISDGTMTLGSSLLAGTSALITLTNPGLNTVIGTPVGVGTGPRGAAVTPDGTKAYIANFTSGNVSVIDTATNTVSATIAVGGDIRGVAITPDGTRAFVTNRTTGTVAVINTATNTLSGPITVGSLPDAVAFTPDGARAYVPNTGSSTVSVINTATNTVSATIPTASNPAGVAISPDGTRAYVAQFNSSGTVSVIDTATNTVSGTITVGSEPDELAVTPDGTRVYVANRLSNNVSVISTATNTVIAIVSVGTNPDGVAISPDGTRVYVANRGSNNVSVIDTATNTLSATLPVGLVATEVAITPDGARAYVTNEGSSTVSVLDVEKATLLVVGSSLTKTGTAPLIDISGAGSTLGLQGGLLKMLDSTGNVAGTLFKATGSPSLTLTPGAPLLVMDHSTLMAGGFLDLTNVTLAMPGIPLALVKRGSTLGTLGGGTAVKISGGSITADTLVSHDGSGNAFIISGTVLDAVNTTLTLRAIASGAGHDDQETVTLTLPLNQPVLKITSTTTSSVLTTTGTGHELIGFGDSNGATPTLAGVALIATASVGFTTTLAIQGALLDLDRLTITATDPFVQLTRAIVTQTATSDPLFWFDPDGGVITTSAPILLAQNTTITGTDDLFGLESGTMISTASAAAFEFSSSSFSARRGFTIGHEGTGSLQLAGSLLKGVSSTFSFTNPSVHTVFTSVTVGSRPFGVVVTPDVSKVLVTNFGSGTVSVIQDDLATVSIPVGTNPKGIAVKPDSSRAYVANSGSGTVSVINVATNSVIGSPIAVGTTPIGVAAKADRVYVANFGAGTVSVIDPASGVAGAVIGSPITVGTNPHGLALTPDGSRLYVANRVSDTVSVIDTATNMVIKTVSIGVGTGPVELGVSRDGRRVYVANQFANTVSVIDTATNAIVGAAIPVGTAPHGVAFSPDGTRALITNNVSNSVSVIDTGTATVIATITTSMGLGPLGIAFAADGADAYVANFDPSGTTVKILEVDRGTAVSLGPGSSLTKTGTAPLIDLSGAGSTLSVQGGLFRAGPSATATITGTVLKASDLTTLSVGGPLVELEASSLTAGGFLDLTNTTLSMPNLPVILVKRSSTLGATSGPALRMTGGSLTADTLVTHDGSGHTFSIAGGAIDLTNATLSVRAIVDRPDQHLPNTSTFTLATGQAFIRLTSTTAPTSLTTTGVGYELFELGDSGLPTPPTVAGVGLVATGAVGFPVTINIKGSLAELEALSGTATSAFVQLSRTTLNQTVTADALLRLELEGKTLTLAGGLLTAADSSAITASGPFFDLHEGVLTSSTTSPFVDLANSTLTAADGFRVGNPLSGTLTLAGSLLKGASSPITFSNPAVHTVTLTLGAGFDRPDGIAFTPSGSRGYVVNRDTNNVSVIDPRTTLVVGTVSVGAGPRSVAVAPDGSKAYVSNRDADTVSVINTATNVVTATIPVGDEPDGIAFAQNGTRAYVTNRQDDTVSVINTATNSVIATIGVGFAFPVAAVATPDGNRVFVVNRDGPSVSVIDTASNTVIATVTVGSEARGAALSPDGRRLYVSSRGTNTVRVVDTETLQQIASIAVAGGPHGVAVSSDGTRVFVTNQDANTLSVIDTATNTVLTTFAVGTFPNGVAASPDGRLAFVANGNADTVSVIDVNRAALLYLGPSATLTKTGSAALVDLSGVAGSLNLQGGLVRALQATATVTGTLLKASDIALTAGAPLIDLDASSLTAGAFLDLTNVTLSMPGIPLTLLKRGSTLRATVGPAIKLTGGSITAAALGHSDGTDNLFDIAGGILDLTNASLTLERFAFDPETGEDHGVFTLALNQPMIKITATTAGSTLSITGGDDDQFFEFGDNEAVTPPTVPGVALVATGAVGFPVTLNIPGAVARLEAGNYTATNPMVQLSRVNLTQTGDAEGLILIDTQGKTVTMAGQLFTADDSTLTLTSGIVDIGQSIVTSATTLPWISLDPTTLTAPFDLVHMHPRFGSSSLTLAGRLLSTLGGSVNLTNTAFNTVTDSFVTGTAPREVAVATGTQFRVLVSNNISNSVSIFNEDTDLVTTVSVGTGPRGITVKPDGSRAFVVNNLGNSVSLIDTATNAVTTLALLASSAPVGIAVRPDGARAYVTNAALGTVSIINDLGALIGSPISVGTSPQGIVVNRLGTRAYVANLGSASVSIIDITTDAPPAPTAVTVGTSPIAVAVHPDGSRVYVVNQGSNTVSVIDTATNTLAATVSLAGAGVSSPSGIGVTPDGARVYVTSEGSSTMAVINTFSLVATGVPVGTTTSKIAIDPFGEEAFVSHLGANTVSMLDVFPGGRILSIAGSTTLTSNGASALIRFDGGSITAGRQVVFVEGTLNVKGPLIEGLNGVTVSSGGSVLLVSRGTLTDTSASASTTALLNFAGDATAKTLSSTGGNIVSLSASPDDFAGALTLKRPVFAANNTTVSSFFNFLTIFDGASLCAASSCGGAASGAALAQFAGGSYTGGTSGVGGAFLRMFSVSTQNPTSFTLSGGFLSASGGATFNASNGTFIDVRNGATLTSSGSAPFLDFSNASATAGFNILAFGGSSTTGGASGVSTAPTASFAGSLFRAQDTSTTLTFSSGGSSAFLRIFDGASVTKTGAAAVIDLIGTAPDKVIIDASANVVSLGATAAAMPAPALTLAGRLIAATRARLESGDPTLNAFSTVFIGDGSIVTKSDSTPLLDLDTTNVVSSGGFVTLRRSPSAGSPSKLLLGGAYLLEAVNSSITTTTTGAGTPCCSPFFVGQGGLLTSTGTGALIRLTNATVNASASPNGGSFFHVTDLGTLAADTFNLTQLPSTVTLSGGILSASDSTITTLFNALAVFRSSLTAGSASSPVLAFTNTAPRTYTFGASPGSLLFATAAPATLFANAALTFNGQLLTTSNSGGTTTFTTNSDFVVAERGATLTSTTTLPFITSSNAVYNVGSTTATSFKHFMLFRDGGGTTGTAPASMSVAGSLLNSTSDTFNVTAGFLEVNDGVFVASATPVVLTKTGTSSPVMTFTNSTVKLGPAASGTAGTGNFIEVNDNTAMNLAGPTTGLFTASFTGGVTPWTVDRLAFSMCSVAVPCTASAGAPGLDTNINTGPLIAFSGAASGAHTVTGAMFHLIGANTTAEADAFTTDAGPAGTGLTVGTDRPLRHSGVLFEGSSSTSVSTNQVVILDTALLEATKPLLNLTSATLTSATDAIHLPASAKLSVTLVSGDALIKLNGSTMTVTASSLVNLAGGSYLKIAGDLVRLDGSSILNLGTVASTNSAFVTVAGGSVFTLTGRLAVYGTGTNAVNITTSGAALCGGCSITTSVPNLAGVPVLLKPGATIANISVASGYTAFSGGTPVFTGTSAVALVLDGSTSKIKLGP